MTDLSSLPKSVDEVEAGCSHPECNEALFDEITRKGSRGWDAEDICVRAEREEAAQYAEAEADYERRMGM